MRQRAFKKAFTLLEVNLAIFIMATGVLSMCALYSLGFRENRQSVEDVAGVAYAETYLAPLVQGLSATNMPWSQWVEIGDEPRNTATESRNVADGLYPAGGWLDYVEHIKDREQVRFRVKGDPRSTANSAWQSTNASIPSPYKGSLPSLPSDFQYALVVSRKGTVIQLSFRCSRRKDQLLMQPVYVSEVRFQGDGDK